MVAKRTFWILISLALFPLVTAAQWLDTTKIDQVLGRSGQKTGDIDRVGFPRTDLQVTVAGVPVKQDSLLVPGRRLAGLTRARP